MTWLIEDTDFREHERNPLVSVVIEVSFYPILKIRDGEGVAHFQDLIRDRFPILFEKKVQSVNIESNRAPTGHSVSLGEEKQYLFQTQDRLATAMLSHQFLRIEYRDHKSRKDAISDIKQVCDSLIRVYAPVNPNRIGVRYINLIKPTEIAEILGRPTTWRELIHKSYLQDIPNLKQCEDTFYSNETKAPVEGKEGELTLRYGITRNGPNSTDKQFHFDIDRALTGEFDIVRCAELTEQFIKDIYTVFLKAAGPSLITWMQAQGTN